MAVELDATQGRTVGARNRLSGWVLGISLSVEEIVTQRMSDDAVMYFQRYG